MYQQKPEAALTQVHYASEPDGSSEDLEMNHEHDDIMNVEDRRDPRGEKVWQVTYCSSTL
jgi:hypothetical protein